MRENGTIEPMATASPIHQFSDASKYWLPVIRWSSIRNLAPINATAHDEEIPISSSHATSLIVRRRQSIFTTRRKNNAVIVYTVMNSTFPTRKEYERTGR